MLKTTNKIIERERERVPIIDNTKKGYSYAYDGDGIDLGLHRKNHRGTVQRQISHTIKAACDVGVISMEDVKAKRLFNIYGEQYGTGFAGNVYDQENISPNLTTAQGGSREPMVLAYDEQNQNIHTDGHSPKHNNRVLVVGNYSPSNYEASRVIDPSGTAPTVKENHGTVNAITTNARIRKLTPKECWRLMGFTDEDFEKAEKVVSTTQLYKQAGNSIVTNCLYHIFKEML